MSPRRRPGGRAGRAVVAIALAAALFALALDPAPVVGDAPVLPIGDDGAFLSALSAPVLAPGGSGTVGFRLADPLPAAMTGVTLRFALYAFAPAPGGSSGTLPAGAVLLPTGGGNESSIAFEYDTVLPGAAPIAGGFPVDASPGAPQGAYAVRSSLTFTANGTAYLLESRGFFSDTAWSAATLPGGNGTTSTLNLTRLGVSGIVPETAIGVRSDPFLLPIVGLVAAGIVLAGVGAYLYYRRGPGSSSGASSGAPPQSAPSAVGK